MINTILSSSVLVALVCGPALADAPSMYRIDFSLRTDGPTHKDTLFVSDDSCGEMHAKSSARDSYLRICAKPLDGKRVRLEIDRRLRDNGDEKRTQAVVIATSGSTYEVLDAKMTVKTQ